MQWFTHGPACLSAMKVFTAGLGQPVRICGLVRRELVPLSHPMNPSITTTLFLRAMHIDDRIFETISRLFRSLSISESSLFMPLSVKAGEWEIHTVRSTLILSPPGQVKDLHQSNIWKWKTLYGRPLAWPIHISMSCKQLRTFGWKKAPRRVYSDLPEPLLINQYWTRVLLSPTTISHSTRLSRSPPTELPPSLLANVAIPLVLPFIPPLFSKHIVHSLPLPLQARSLLMWAAHMARSPSLLQRHITYPHLRYIVQDLPEVITRAPKGQSAEKSVEFHAHDFFTPQPLRDVAVFYLRHILHNWGDAHAIKILKGLIPGMRQGTRILIHEHVLEHQKQPMWKRRLESAMDLNMMVLLNAHERDEAAWRALLHSADLRFTWVGVRRQGGSALAIVEASWEGHSIEMS